MQGGTSRPVAEAHRALRTGPQGLGYNAGEAAIIADHAIGAALCGYDYSGLAKLLNIPEHRRFKQPRRKMSILRETPVSTQFDGGNNVGMLAIFHAARHAIEKAQGRGFAVVGVTNSWMSGRSAYYVEMTARADLVGIHTAAPTRGVAPPGGIRPAVGTNPIAFGLPPADGPVVFDMGTSAFMLTDAAYRERMGKLLPERVAIDSGGARTAGRHPAVWAVTRGLASLLSFRLLGYRRAQFSIRRGTTAICWSSSNPIY